MMNGESQAGVACTENKDVKYKKLPMVEKLRIAEAMKAEIQKSLAQAHEREHALYRERNELKAEVSKLKSHVDELSERLHKREMTLVRWEERARTMSLCELDKDVFPGDRGIAVFHGRV